MKKPIPPRLRKFPAAKQRRLDQLLEKNKEATITPSESATLSQLVAEAETLMVANAKRLEEFYQGEASSRHVDAVPVTVWVQPLNHHAER